MGRHLEGNLDSIWDELNRSGAGKEPYNWDSSVIEELNEDNEISTVLPCNSPLFF